jgi:hypothetical protein
MIDEPEQAHGSFVLTDAQRRTTAGNGLWHFAERASAVDECADVALCQPLERFIVVWSKQYAHPPKAYIDLCREKGAQQQVAGNVLMVALQLYVLTRTPLLGEHVICECDPVECPHGP